MSNIDQINRAMNLLSQALGAATNSLTNDKSVIDAKSHIKTAMKKLESAKVDHANKKIKQQTLHEKWWGNVKSGVSNFDPVPNPMVASKSLKNIQSLIKAEQNKIDTIEQKVKDATSGPPQILKD